MGPLAQWRLRKSQSFLGEALRRAPSRAPRHCNLEQRHIEHPWRLTESSSLVGRRWQLGAQHQTSPALMREHRAVLVSPRPLAAQWAVAPQVRPLSRPKRQRRAHPRWAGRLVVKSREQRVYHAPSCRSLLKRRQDVRDRLLPPTTSCKWALPFSQFRPDIQMATRIAIDLRARFPFVTPPAARITKSRGLCASERRQVTEIGFGLLHLDWQRRSPGELTTKKKADLIQCAPALSHTPKRSHMARWHRPPCANPGAAYYKRYGGEGTRRSPLVWDHVQRIC